MSFWTKHSTGLPHVLLMKRYKVGNQTHGEMKLLRLTKVATQPSWDRTRTKHKFMQTQISLPLFRDCTD